MVRLVALAQMANKQYDKVMMSQLFSLELPDEELVHLCQSRGAKDDRPFQELFRRYQSFVWRICYGYTYNSDDAEDLTQEVFFKVYRSLEQFERRSSFKTWLYRIAINTAQNELRRRSRRPQVAEMDVDTMAETISADTTVEGAWQGKVRQELLTYALAQLKQEEYEILRLKDLEKRSYAEISEKLGIGLSAAKMRAQRARLALQTIYRQLEGEGAS